MRERERESSTMRSIWKVKVSNMWCRRGWRDEKDGGRKGDAKNPNEDCVLLQFTAATASKCGALIIFKLPAKDAGKFRENK